MTIADSGERKTTCDGFFTSAIREHEREQAEKAKPDLTKHKADMAAWEAQRAGLVDAIKRDTRQNKNTDNHQKRLQELEEAKPKPVRVPKLVRGDDTPENLAWALAREWPSAGVLSSEAGLIFGAHGMGKDSIMRNLGLLNILWEAGTLSIGRRTSESFTLRGARLTIGLQTQEATLRSFFDRSDGLARGTGFLARFLLSWPESTQGFRPFFEAPEAWPALAAFNRRIAELLAIPVPIDADGALSPAMLTLSPEAKAAWVAFHDTIEHELRKGGELHDVRDVAAKTADNAVRLAANFHALKHGVSGAVDKETFEGASRIAAWHLHEARRFFGELALPNELADTMRLDDWLLAWCRQKKKDAVSRREVQQYVIPTRLRDGENLGRALRELADAGRIREVVDGRRKDIQVNPALLQGGGA